MLVCDLNALSFIEPKRKKKERNNYIEILDRDIRKICITRIEKSFYSILSRFL